MPANCDVPKSSLLKDGIITFSSKILTARVRIAQKMLASWPVLISLLFAGSRCFRWVYADDAPHLGHVT